MSWPVSWAEVAFGGGPHVSGLVSLLADYCGLPLVVAESVLSALPHPLAAQIRLEQSTYKRAELLLSQPMTLDLAKALTAWVRAQHACLKRQIHVCYHAAQAEVQARPAIEGAASMAGTVALAVDRIDAESFKAAVQYFHAVTVSIEWSLLHPIMRRRLHELQTLHQSLRADIVSGAQLFVDVRRVLPAIIDQGKLALAACRAATPSLADLQEQTRQMIKGICHVLQRIFGVHARTIQPQTRSRIREYAVKIREAGPSAPQNLFELVICEDIRVPASRKLAKLKGQRRANLVDMAAAAGIFHHEMMVAVGHIHDLYLQASEIRETLIKVAKSDGGTLPEQVVLSLANDFASFLQRTQSFSEDSDALVATAQFWNLPVEQAQWRTEPGTDELDEFMPAPEVQIALFGRVRAMLCKE